jgi:hypothetical protein
MKSADAAISAACRLMHIPASRQDQGSGPKADRAFDQSRAPPGNQQRAPSTPLRQRRQTSPAHQEPVLPEEPGLERTDLPLVTRALGRIECVFRHVVPEDVGHAIADAPGWAVIAPSRAP